MVLDYFLNRNLIFVSKLIHQECILPSSAQFQLNEVEAEMFFICNLQPPGKVSNSLAQLIIGK